MAKNSQRIVWNVSPTTPDESSAIRPENAPVTDQIVYLESHPATPLLDSTGRDITRLAGEGKIHPFFGREKELLQLQRILIRKEKNNPLIIGEPGVGKTALVEGLALQIQKRTTNELFHHFRIVELSLTRLLAGTNYRGDLESRLDTIIQEASADPRLILFIDEIHTLVRAGSVQGGSLDAANILKPPLARGQLRIIGATTPGETEKFLHIDKAFERRFDPLILNETTPSEATEILLAARLEYEEHHHLKISDDAVRAAVKLSTLHILDRFLPDKAFDLLDSACSLARLPDVSQSSSYPVLVDEKMVTAVLAQRLNLPPERIEIDYRSRLKDLEGFLKGRIIGQEQAISRINSGVISSFMRDSSKRSPRRVFAFFGSSGVGKTAVASALAEFFFGSPDAMIRLDLSEFREAYSISRLSGSPPGYIGYQDEGSFASRLRRTPFCVVLLDEFEKGHPAIHEFFLPIFDEGRFSDASGRIVDASQAFFILTSNLFQSGETGQGEEYQAQIEVIRQNLRAYFSPELINRLQDIVLFSVLQPAALAQIAAKEIGDINRRFSVFGFHIQASEQTLMWIAGQTFDPQFGARSLKRFLSHNVEEVLVQKWMGEKEEEKGAYRLEIEDNRLVFNRF